MATDTSVTQAVRKLRTAMGETQQSLANKLGLAISSMVRYETTRPPHGEMLVKFMKLADAYGQPELAAIFQIALAEELGYPVQPLREDLTFQIIHPDERQDFEALAAILRLDGFTKEREEWQRISRRAKSQVAESNANAIAMHRLNTEIQKCIAAGNSDDEIVAKLKLSAWDPQEARTLITTRRELSHFKKEEK